MVHIFILIFFRAIDLAKYLIFSQEQDPVFIKVLLSFSIYTNTIKLFKITKSNDQLDCLSKFNFCIKFRKYFKMHFFLINKMQLDFSRLDGKQQTF
jgi:hypothetical protein